MSDQTYGGPHPVGCLCPVCDWHQKEGEWFSKTLAEFFNVKLDEKPLPEVPTEDQLKQLREVTYYIESKAPRADPVALGLLLDDYERLKKANESLIDSGYRLNTFTMHLSTCCRRGGCDCKLHESRLKWHLSVVEANKK